MKPFDVFVGFVVGAAVGSAASYYILNRTYAKVIDEEVKKIKEEFKDPRVVDFFSKYDTRSEEIETSDTSEPETPRVKLKRRKPGEKGYTDYTAYSKKSEDAEEESSDEVIINDFTGDPDALPEIIYPDSFQDEEGYATISLLYTSDGVLLDEDDEIFDSVDCVPSDFAEHFGEYDDDTVYAKNDRIRTYYEILRSAKSSKEIFENKRRYGE